MVFWIFFFDIKKNAFLETVFLKLNITEGRRPECLSGPVKVITCCARSPKARVFQGLVRVRSSGTVPDIVKRLNRRIGFTEPPFLFVCFSIGN